MREKKRAVRREKVGNIVPASALRITSTTIDLSRFSSQTQLNALSSPRPGFTDRS